MSFDESDLYTGLASPSYLLSKAQKDKSKQIRESERAKVTPSALLINELIEQEKKTVLDLKSLIVDGSFSTNDDIKAELLARQLTYKFIVNFQTSVNNLLREPRKRAVKDE